MQVNDRVVCVFAGDCLNIETHGTYVITAVYPHADEFDVYIDVATLDGNECGTYNHKRFMLEKDMVKQVLENARNG